MKGVDVTFLAEIALGVHFGVLIAKSMSEAGNAWVEYARVLLEAGGVADDDHEPSNTLLVAWVKFSFIIPATHALLCTAAAFLGSLLFRTGKTGLDRELVATAVALSVLFSGSLFRLIADERAKRESGALPVKRMVGASMVVAMALLGGFVSFFAYEGVAYALFALATTLVACTTGGACAAIAKLRRRELEK